MTISDHHCRDPETCNFYNCRFKKENFNYFEQQKITAGASTPKDIIDEMEQKND